MRSYAFIENNTVVDKKDLEEDSLELIVAKYQNVIDITDQVPQPQLGWKFNGTSLNPDYTDMSVTQILELKNKNARSFGRSLAAEMVDKFAARNIEAGLTESQIVALFSQLINLKIIMENGALKTAKIAIAAAKPTLPVYADLFDYATSRIDKYLAGEL